MVHGFEAVKVVISVVKDEVPKCVRDVRSLMKRAGALLEDLLAAGGVEVLGRLLPGSPDVVRVAAMRDEIRRGGVEVFDPVLDFGYVGG